MMAVKVSDLSAAIPFYGGQPTEDISDINAPLMLQYAGLDERVNAGWPAYEKALKKSMAYYYASITQIDYEVGRMIKVLKEKGLYDNTIIIYTSDHGEHLGYHHQILKGGHLYESIMKVPLIIKYPKNQFSGTTNNKLVSNVDLAPTILNTIGLKTPKTMSGQDLTDNSSNREYVFAHSWLGSQAMCRSKKFKLIKK